MRGNLQRQRWLSAVEGSIPASAGEPAAGRRPPTDGRVYPRECGGTALVRMAGEEATGLSPRVRGNRPVEGIVGLRAGSIPASAGEPSCSSPTSLAGRVYPRECGGTRCDGADALDGRGLSPRVRGNRRRLPRQSDLRGSIPASAGEPSEPTASRPRWWVYPRECGGTARDADLRLQTEGLSPRVRGNRLRHRHAPNGFGSIPASAGEPSPASPFPRR